MSLSSVPGIIAALAMKPVSPMLARSIANACLEVAAARPSTEPPPAATAPPDAARLDLRA